VPGLTLYQPLQLVELLRARLIVHGMRLLCTALPEMRGACTAVNITTVPASRAHVMVYSFAGDACFLYRHPSHANITTVPASRAHVLLQEHCAHCSTAIGSTIAAVRCSLLPSATACYESAFVAILRHMQWLLGTLWWYPQLIQHVSCPECEAGVCSTYACSAAC
jgi:hypothetical protein